MAKNDVNLGVNVDESVVEEQKKVQSNEGKNVKNQKKAKSGKKGKAANKPSFGAKIAKMFREIISELKKVEWPSLKRTKNNPGVWANTGTVIIVVLFFLIVITAFDIGLLSLFKLLVGIK
ncbi:MAG: preprotein translocase subunit SecE [Clostridia bacterium]|nr:preprotein translocase subunit SecE [Clostridia bacterium]MBO7156201.1 preprotein translocase subunit SecE [Clostridia bacterium]